RILLERWGLKDKELLVYEYLPKELDYYTFMLNSKFCLCPSGYEVASPRIVEAIYSGCVPVIISKGYVLPFADVLRWEKFSIQMGVADIPRLKEILKAVTDDEYKRLKEGVKAVSLFLQWLPPPPSPSFSSSTSSSSSLPLEEREPGQASTSTPATLSSSPSPPSPPPTNPNRPSAIYAVYRQEFNRFDPNSLQPSDNLFLESLRPHPEFPRTVRFPYFFNNDKTEVHPHAEIPHPVVRFPSFGASSLRDRTKDILSVVLALLFGVGCGALTSATMYLVWSVVTSRYESQDSDGEDGEDNVGANAVGYVKIPAAPVKEGYEGK
ncbi:hypothetical protein ACLOJK_035381, partial [Asimina triloba]